MSSERAVLNENDVFSILVVWTKKWYSSFLKKLFVFQKIWIKVNVLKTFKSFTDCHIKTCRSFKRRAVLNIPSTLFRRIYALSVGFKIKTLRKSVFECQDKNQLGLCCKITERSNHSFLLTIWWITFIRHLYNNGIKGTLM